jgi:transketolase
MAIAEAQLEARYNRPGFEVIDHTTYAIVSDRDLMEGVSAEAVSLAGRLRLGKLICLYDDNKVTLAAGTDVTFSEDRVRRVAAYGWHTESVADGNDLASNRQRLAARGRGSISPLIDSRVYPHRLRVTHKHDSFEAHGSPLGVDEVRLNKENLGWPAQPPFLIPEEALVRFREAMARGTSAEAAWKARMAAYARAFPDLAEELRRSLSGELPPGLRRGAYVLADWPGGMPELVLVASGTEVALIVEAATRLQADGTRVRAVSMPSWELFDTLPQIDRDAVLPPSVRARGGRSGCLPSLAPLRRRRRRRRQCGALRFFRTGGGAASSVWVRGGRSAAEHYNACLDSRRSDDLIAALQLARRRQ